MERVAIICEVFGEYTEQRIPKANTSTRKSLLNSRGKEIRRRLDQFEEPPMRGFSYQRQEEPNHRPGIDQPGT